MLKGRVAEFLRDGGCAQHEVIEQHHAQIARNTCGRASTYTRLGQGPARKYPLVEMPTTSNAVQFAHESEARAAPLVSALEGLRVPLLLEPRIR